MTGQKLNIDEPGVNLDLSNKFYYCLSFAILSLNHDSPDICILVQYI